MSRLDDYETWKRETKNAIFAASIALQAHEYVNSGHGGVTKEAMLAFMEEAAAVSELWEEVQAP